MVTSIDVARLAGVSQATVSRVLSGHPAVKSDTRERVLEAMKASSYRPNLAARSMKTSRIGTIGVVVARLTNPLYPELLLHLGAALQGHDRQMLVWHSESGGEEAAVAAARQGLVDGVVFAATTSASLPAVQETAKRVPVVLVHRSLKGADVDLVEVDNAGGTRLVVDMFLRAGKKRPAIVAGERIISTVRVREDAYLAAAKKNWSQPVAQFRVTHASYEEGFRIGQEIAGQRTPPDCVFCVNDVIALGCLDGIKASGMRVPKDVWLAGFDDVAMASWSSFQLTTVHQPLKDMAKAAVDRLLLRLTSEEPLAFSRMILKPLLIVRGTGGDARGAEAPPGLVAVSSQKGSASRPRKSA